MKLKEVLLTVGLSLAFFLISLTFFSRYLEGLQKEELEKQAELLLAVVDFDEDKKLDLKLNTHSEKLSSDTQIAFFDPSGNVEYQSSEKQFAPVVKNKRLRIETPYEKWTYQSQDEFYYFRTVKNGYRTVGKLGLTVERKKITSRGYATLGILTGLFSSLLGFILYQKRQLREKRQRPYQDIVPVLQGFLSNPEKLQHVPQAQEEWRQVYRLLDELMQKTNHFYYEQVVSEGRLQKILENLDIGVVIQTEKKRRIYSSVAEDLLFKQNQLEEKIELAVKKLTRQTGEIRELVSLEFPYPKDLEIVVKGLSFKEGRVEEWLAMFYDITPIKKTERMQESFIRNISHELKTPTTAILGFSETLIEEDVDVLEQKHFLEIIYKESQRLNELIQKILVLSRSEDYFDQEQLNWILIPIIIQNEIERYKQLSSSRKIKITSLIEGEIGSMRLPQEYLQPIIKNLLENAINYSYTETEIEVKAWCTASYLKISILDHGVGIPKEEQEKIFEKFYRVDKSRNRASGGSGLGLSIVKHYTELLDGELQLTSEENEGTYIVIRVPKERTIKKE